MAGTWKGFEVRIKYHVEYRAKQSPIIYHVISARLQPADVPPAPIFDGATVRNDWFEVKRDGELELAEISNLLDRAINTARHLAEKGSAK